MADVPALKPNRRKAVVSAAAQAILTGEAMVSDTWVEPLDKALCLIN
jgi:hypothetical protein